MSPVPRAGGNVTSQEKTPRHPFPPLMQRKPHSSTGSSVYLPIHRFNSGNLMRSLMIQSYSSHGYYCSWSPDSKKYLISTFTDPRPPKISFSRRFLNRESAKCPFLSKRHLVTPALVKISPLHMTKIAPLHMAKEEVQWLNQALCAIFNGLYLRHMPGTGEKHQTNMIFFLVQVLEASQDAVGYFR